MLLAVPTVFAVDDSGHTLYWFNSQTKELTAIENTRFTHVGSYNSMPCATDTNGKLWYDANGYSQEPTDSGHTITCNDDPQNNGANIPMHTALWGATDDRTGWQLSIDERGQLWTAFVGQDKAAPIPAYTDIKFTDAYYVDNAGSIGWYLLGVPRPTQQNVTIAATPQTGDPAAAWWQWSSYLIAATSVGLAAWVTFSRRRGVK